MKRANQWRFRNIAANPLSLMTSPADVGPEARVLRTAVISLSLALAIVIALLAYARYQRDQATKAQTEANTAKASAVKAEKEAVVTALPETA